MGRDLVVCMAYLVMIYAIPEDLVVNADRTGLQLLPVGSEKTYTMKGAKSVVVSGSGDKRQISLLLSFSAVGTFLPGEAIFEGKTSAVIPSGQYARYTTETHGMAPHPHGQPLVQCFQYERFADFSVHWITEKLKAGVAPKDITLETHIGILRNRICEWLWNAHNQINGRFEMLLAAWRKCGLLDAWNKTTQTAADSTNLAGTLFKTAPVMDVKEENCFTSTEEYLGDVTIEESFNRVTDH